MSITDELREWVSGAKPAVVDGCSISVGTMTYGCKKALLAIADRIDAEHEAACAEAYGNGVMSVPIALDESQWVKLPVDADGVPLRIGDKVDSDHHEDGTVIGIQYFKAPNGVVFEEIAVQPNGWDTATWRDPEEYAHHHEPTVEDVLREFAEKVIDSQIPSVHPTYEEAIAEYAAKLRLANSEESFGVAV